MPLTEQGAFVLAESMAATISVNRNIAAHMERLGGGNHPASAEMLQEADEYERALAEYRNGVVTNEPA